MDLALLCPHKTTSCNDEFCKKNCKDDKESKKSFFGMIKVLPRTTQKCDEPKNPVINDSDDILTNFRFNKFPIWSPTEAPVIVTAALHDKSQTYVSVKSFAPKIDVSYELKVLKYIKESISHAIQHFPVYLADYKYTEKQLSAVTDEAFKVFIDAQKIKERRFVVTSPVLRETLYEFLDLHAGAELAYQQNFRKNAFSIIFQLYFILHTMTELGIQHNNLNINKNVFVVHNTSSRCTDAIYYVNFELFRIPLEFQVYIDDFTLSSCEACGTNAYLKQTKKDTKRDTYMVFSQLNVWPRIDNVIGLRDLINFTIGTDDIKTLSNVINNSNFFDRFNVNNK